MEAFEFAESKTFAIAGVSREKKNFGNYVFRKLKEMGYRVLPINPNTAEIDGTVCYANVSALPDDISHLIVMTSKSQTMLVVESAVRKGIRNIWVQQSSETAEVIAYADGKSNNFFFKKCILMYSNPTGMHKFHRIVSDLFKK